MKALVGILSISEWEDHEFYLATKGVGSFDEMSNCSVIDLVGKLNLKKSLFFLKWAYSYILKFRRG